MDNSGVLSFSSLLKSSDNDKEKSIENTINEDKKRSYDKAKKNKAKKASISEKKNKDKSNLEKSECSYTIDDFRPDYQNNNYNTNPQHQTWNQNSYPYQEQMIMYYQYINYNNPLFLYPPYQSNSLNNHQFSYQYAFDPPGVSHPETSATIMQTTTPISNYEMSFTNETEKLDEINNYNDELEKLLTKKNCKFIALKSFLYCEDLKVFLSEDSIMKDVVHSLTYFNTLSYSQKHILTDALFMKLLPNLKYLLPVKRLNIIVKFIFKRISEEQVKEVFVTIRDDLANLCSNEIAKKSLVALIRSDLQDSVQIWITHCLKNWLFHLSTNINGADVVQKIISKFSEQGKSDVVSFIFKSFLPLANNEVGVNVIIKLIIDIQHRDDKKEELLGLIKPNLPELLKTENSSRSIEAILQCWKVEECKEITDFVYSGFFEYSQNQICIKIINTMLDSPFVTSVSI